MERVGWAHRPHHGSMAAMAAMPPSNADIHIGKAPRAGACIDLYKTNMSLRQQCYMVTMTNNLRSTKRNALGRSTGPAAPSPAINKR